MSTEPKTAATGGAMPISPAAELVTLEIDGRTVRAPKGSMVIQAADAAGIYIPRFCYHEKLSIAANCRMCLVEVERAPKPLPACATPVAEGMKVYTRSPKARDAQKGTMEFLLINHPLDCPICDQGGECPLQDQALGYGKDASRYTEGKRVVADKDIGPLIATFMTRCIHCTRCVRFGREIAGVMEFGALGRGEHMEIRTFLDRSVDSEVSGNMIDLCPVGALTSKPFQYKARAWELEHHPGVSPHDCVGANLDVQTLRQRVMRVLPRANEAVNEIWLADRDRFSYEALGSAERLTRPLIRRDGRWEEVDWTTALEFTVAGLKRLLAAHGPEQLGALLSPTATLEEAYLLQKLVRALGSPHVDHRLRQTDFRDDAELPLYPSLGLAIPELERLETVLLIGANLRKDQPLLNLRLRKAARRGARILALHAVDYDLTYPLAAKAIVAPSEMPRVLAAVAVRLAALKQVPIPAEIEPIAAESSAEAEAIAARLAQSDGAAAAVLVGLYGLNHPQAATLRWLARWIAQASGARLGFLPEAASAGAWLAGCVPHRGPGGGRPLPRAGMNAYEMLRSPRKGYLVLGAEPELDCLDGVLAAKALAAAEFTVLLTSFKPSPYRTPRAVECAQVCLPLAPFTETAGTFVNAEGRRQSFEAAVRPLGETRPGWKILRMLGHLMGLAEFSYEDIGALRRELDATLSRLREGSAFEEGPFPTAATAVAVRAPGSLERIAEVPIYAVDPIVRRAPALQRTADNPPPAARLNAREAARLGLAEGTRVRVLMTGGEARLPVVIDERVADGAVLIPSGYPETAGLPAHGPVELIKEEGA
jgi:NADH-quinone oxidoreductase subunit G